MLSVVAVALVYGVRQQRAESSNDLDRFRLHVWQQEREVAEVAEELNHPISDEEKAEKENLLAWDRKSLEENTALRKTWEDDLAASKIYLVFYQIVFSAAAALFFVFGLLRLRTFGIWLRSRPRDPSRPSAAYQQVKVGTSLTRDYAIARALTAVKKTGARIVELNAEEKPCTLLAVRYYKGPSSYFEDIRIQITEVENGSTIGISVDGLRPTFRSDIARNQLILNALLNDVTS